MPGQMHPPFTVMSAMRLAVPIAWGFLIQCSWGVETQPGREIRYLASAGCEPQQCQEARFQVFAGGSATVASDRQTLQTSDSDRAADGRYYFLPSDIGAVGRGENLELTVTVDVPLSQGHVAATSISVPVVDGALVLGPYTTGGHGEGYQDLVAGGRRIGIGFLSDGVDHERDEILLLDREHADGVGVVGRRKLPLNVSRKYHLRLDRKSGSPDDDTVTLSIDAPDVEPISALLKNFTPSVKGFSRGLLFGHEIGSGVAEANWKEVSFRTSGAGVASTVSAPTPEVTTPRAIGNQKQLFLDDWIIASRENLEREQGRPVKFAGNPVLKREHPWEAARCELYGSAIWRPDLDRLQLFYSAMKQPYDSKLAFAESSDGGRTWTRPKLNQFPWEGSPSNIVWPGRYWAHGPAVMFDPHDRDPARRYKLFVTAAPVDLKLIGTEGPRGIDVAFSPDGIKWTAAETNPVIAEFNSDTGNSVFWDESRQKYRAYVRLRQTDGFRTVGLTESPDFVNWSAPRTVYAPTPEDRERRWNFYGLSVTPYEGIYVGLVWIYPGKPESDSASSDTPATWPELVISRDGEHWQRVFFGAPFLPLGLKGSFDHRMIRTASSFAVLPEQLVLMYSGSPDPHGAGAKWDIGQATLRLDGFAAMHAADVEGTLVTQPLAFDAGKLYVNAAAAPDGYVKAELLDANGKVVTGYAEAECKSVTGDQIHAPVTWTTKSNLPRSTTAGMQLRFVLRKAQLYSFQIAP